MEPYVYMFLFSKIQKVWQLQGCCEHSNESYSNVPRARGGVTDVGIDQFLNFAGLGFEPRLTAPEAIVLPLDDPAINFCSFYLNFRQIIDDFIIFLNHV